MTSASSCGKPAMVSDKTVRSFDKSLHAQNASSAANIKDDLVLENMLVLVDCVSI
jgi:hypothetical protein